MKTIDKTKTAPKFAEPVKGKVAPHPESDTGKAVLAKVRDLDAEAGAGSGKTVQVFLRGLDADVHRRFKVACARRGKSQTLVLKELILEYTRRKEGDK